MWEFGQRLMFDGGEVFVKIFFCAKILVESITRVFVTVVRYSIAMELRQLLRSIEG